MRVSANKGVLYSVISLIIILSGTYFAIQYAKGNYRVTDAGFNETAGLLAANSFPTGAEVYVDDKLVSATNDTLYLDPGEYSVRISKDGFTTWEKMLRVEKELVTQTNAQLFPSAPSLTPLTFTGVQNLSPSPDGQRILYYADSNSDSDKNGLYILEMSGSALSLQRGPRQVSQDTPLLDLSSAQFIWSPDSSQVIVITPEKEFLMEVNTTSDPNFLPALSAAQKATVLDEWEEEMYLREKQFLTRFPPEIIQIATQSANNVYVSPDKKRLLYTATAAVTIPDEITPPLPAASTQAQERTLTPGGIYIYDREEDRNFRVGTESTNQYTPKQLISLDLGDTSILPQLSATPSAYRTLQASDSAQTVANYRTYHSPLYSDTLQWYPNSRHLIFTDQENILIMEYDGTNTNTLYSGPFAENFVYPWPDGSQLVIATSFSPNTPPNLYAIELK